MRLDLHGQLISEITIGYEGILTTNLGSSIRIEGDFYLVESQDELENTKKSGEDNFALLEKLRGAVIDEVTIDKTGQLLMSFSDGKRLIAVPDRHYESWEINFPNREKYICMPGGEIAIWDAR